MPPSARIDPVRTGILVLAGASLVVLLVLCIGGRAALQNILRMKPGLFLVALGLQIAHTALWALRWSLIIRAQGQKVPREILGITFSGAFFNNITPVAKSGGEPVRAYLLGKMNHTTPEEGMASVVVDRIFDMAPFVIICLITFALIFVSHLAANLFLLTLILLGLIASGVLSVVLTLACLRKEAGLRIVLFFFDKLKPILRRFGPVEELRSRLEKALGRFYLGVKTISENRRLLLASMLISLLLWLIIILRLKTVFASLGSEQSLLVINVVSVGAVFVEFLPLLPGGLVSTEATMIALFIGLGVHKDLSTSAVLLDRVISYWAVTIIGAATTFYFGLRQGLRWEANATNDDGQKTDREPDGERSI